MENNIKEKIYKVSDILRGSFPYEIYCDILCVLCFFKIYFG